MPRIVVGVMSERVLVLCEMLSLMRSYSSCVSCFGTYIGGGERLGDRINGIWGGGPMRVGDYIIFLV